MACGSFLCCKNSGILDVNLNKERRMFMITNIILALVTECVAEGIVVLAGIARCKIANKDVQEQAREDAEQMEYLHQYAARKEVK